MDDFYNRNFTKFTDYVTISQNVTGGVAVLPNVDFPKKIELTDYGVEGAYAYVRNYPDYSSLVWQVEVQYMGSDPVIFDFAGGGSVDLEDIVYSTYSRNYYLRYTTPNGIAGRLKFTTKIEENYDCCADIDEDYTDTGSEESGTDSDSADSQDADNDSCDSADSDENSDSAKKKSSGCSALVL